MRPPAGAVPPGGPRRTRLDTPGAGAGRWPTGRGRGRGRRRGRRRRTPRSGSPPLRPRKTSRARPRKRMGCGAGRSRVSARRALPEDMTDEEGAQALDVLDRPPILTRPRHWPPRESRSLLKPALLAVVLLGAGVERHAKIQVALGG